MEQPYPPTPTPCPNWHWLLMSRPMPGPATPVGEWPRPHSMMKIHGMMTSKPHTCQSTAWFGERTAAMEKQSMERWKPPGEVPAGDLVTRWILVRRRPHLRPSTLPVEPPAGFNWWSSASLMMRCPGMNWSSL